MALHSKEETKFGVLIIFVWKIVFVAVAFPNTQTMMMSAKHHLIYKKANRGLLAFAMGDCKRRAFLHSSSSCITISSTPSSLHSSPSQSADNYYTLASSMSTSSSTSKQHPSDRQHPSDSQTLFPKWWPASDSEQTKYMKFADHVAHVIVPNITNTDRTEEDTISGENNATTALKVKDVLHWVLQSERDRKFDDNIPSTHHHNNSLKTIVEECDPAQLRIETEWNEGEEVSTSLKVLDPAYRHDPTLYPQDSYNTTRPNLNAAELLALGSVWHLPFSTINTNIDRFDPSSGSKPARLNYGDWNKTVQPGEYFRVHFDPRRFVDTNLYDWGTDDGEINDRGEKPGVIVARDDEAGYIIINKPPNIPVHARVDNLLENVASSVGRMLWLERRQSILSDMKVVDGIDSTDEMFIETDDGISLGEDIRRRKNQRRKNRKQKVEPLVYVATPQRLDQNTSGLLVVGTKKSFAAYFAKLLRTKTSGQLEQHGESSSQYPSNCGVHKTYKCLVCISPQNEAGSRESTTTSMASEVDRLKGYTNLIMKHYLEPSIRAPKRFVKTVPKDADNFESWAECLLKVTNVTNVCTVVGNGASEALAKSLWGEYGKPDGCIAIAECEIELLTGRTHQIRGQLAAEGFPLVGDVQYSGAVPNTSSIWKERCKGRVESFLDSERLALQCCSLEFLDPDHNVTLDGIEKKKARRSQRWMKFRLESAFWSPFLSQYDADSSELSSSRATSSLDAEVPLIKQATEDSGLRPDANIIATADLPERVLLSQGSNKYIVVRAHLDNNEEWFVRSASPEECGGPYHANVAESLLQQLHSLGYTTKVMGGGRIDYVKEKVKHAHVFGFSYGFGKGDHEKVSEIIEQHTDIIATFDNSNGLY